MFTDRNFQFIKDQIKVGFNANEHAGMLYEAKSCKCIDRGEDQPFTICSDDKKPIIGRFTNSSYDLPIKISREDDIALQLRTFTKNRNQAFILHACDLRVSKSETEFRKIERTCQTTVLAKLKLNYELKARVRKVPAYLFGYGKVTRYDRDYIDAFEEYSLIKKAIWAIDPFFWSLCVDDWQKLHAINRQLAIISAEISVKLRQKNSEIHEPEFYQVHLKRVAV